MKYEGFDELTKELSAPVTRRRALQSFIVGGATGAIALLESPRASAATPGRCRKVHVICRQDYECCSFFCNPSTGRCACPQGTNFCKKSGQCIRCQGGGTYNPDNCTCTCPVGTVQCSPFTCCPDLSGHPDCCPGGYCNYYSSYYGSYYC